MPMTRHERCLAAIARRPVDRIPTYCSAISCEVSSQILGRTAYTGTCSLHFAEVRAWAQGEQAHAEWEAQHLQDIADLHRALDIDVFTPAWRMNWAPTLQIDEYTFLFGDPDAEHVVYHYDPASGEFAPIREIRRPQSPEERIRELALQVEADADSLDDRIERDYAEHLRTFEQLGREFFVASSGGGIVVGVTEDDLLALALAPDWMRRKIMVQARSAVAVGRWCLRHALPGVMLGGGDLAGNTGPMYSPAMFRAVVLPGYQYAVDRLNAMGVHYLFRSDGNIWPLADMLFAEARCPGFGEADRDAAMTVAALRARYPELVVWGNMSSNFLVQRTAQEVRDEARRHIDEAGGRGFFQACSNAIVTGTPPDNVIALFETR